MCLAAGVGGCRASVSAKADTSGEANANASFETDGENSSDDGEGASDDLVESTTDYALLGARHDLDLADSARQARCSCLAVALGQPGDPAFAWHAGPPTIDTDNQMVIALSSKDISCSSEPDRSLGASYWGFRRENGNVGGGGRVRSNRPAPITEGAIIPRPDTGGRVLIRPRNRKVVYGRHLNDPKRDCALNTPALPASN